MIGIKKILALPDALDKRRINLRGLIEKHLLDSSKNQSTLTPDNFADFLWSASFVLVTIQWVILGIPFAILNLLADSENLKVLAWVEIFVSIFTICLLLGMRKCCDKDMKGCQQNQDLQYYPKKNLVFLLPMGGRMTAAILPGVLGFIEIGLTYGASAESEYDNWLRILNMVVGTKKVIGCMGYFYSNVFVVHSMWQRESISLRESLLLRKIIQKTFSWGLFKVEIGTQDQFAYVNGDQQSTSVLWLHPRNGYGKVYFPYLLGVSGMIMMGVLMLLTVNLK